MSTIERQIRRAEQLWDATRKDRKECKGELCKAADGEAMDWRRIDERSRIFRRLDGLGDREAAERLMNEPIGSFNPLERVLNENQMTGIDFFERGLIAARRVARVQIRSHDGVLQGHGSGVLIAPRLLMTNNHVLSNEAEAAASTAQFGYLSDANEIEREPENYAIDPDAFFVTNAALDFTIVALSPLSAEGKRLDARGWCPLIPGSGKALVSERVNIIQHPGGERMQIAVRENTIVAVVDNFLQYETDTRPGSSGSPVFNEQWEMAALHNAGVPKRDAAGNILMQGDVPWTGLRSDVHKILWIANQGVRVSRIVAHVNDLALPPAWAALWQATFSPPAVSSVWDLFEGGAGQPPAAPHPPGSAETNTNAAVDDQASWLFRLSFGPVGNATQLPRDITPLPARPAVPAPAAPSAPPAGAGPAIRPPQPPSPPGDAESLAAQFLERFGHDGPYYDAAEDAEMAKAYWADIDFDAPRADLFAQISQHIGQTHARQHSYRRARHEFLYPAIDLHEDGTLHNVYSGHSFDPQDALAQEFQAALSMAEASGMESVLADPALLLEDAEIWDILEENSNLPYNCEHVVPQSWFGKRQPMRADIHHLFACEPGCNSFRSNIPYWQFDITDEVERQECGRREGNKFEPEHSKGAVARATFYFLMRYPGEVGDKRSELTKSRLRHLLSWHDQFPVDTYERHRNWLTQKAQGNRNPFIDAPEIATRSLLSLGFGSR